MTFDRKAEYRTQLEHLISMAKIPQFKAHAWAQAKHWDADDSGLFRGISADLMAAMSPAGRECDPGFAVQIMTKRL